MPIVQDARRYATLTELIDFNMMRRSQPFVHKKIGVKVIKRSTMATIVALLALLGAAAPAMATTEEFVTSYALGPGAFASGSAHTNVSNSHKDGFGVTRPAVAAGYGGFTGNPNSGGNFTAGSNCGTGDRIWNPSGTSCCTFHGAVWNQTLGVQAVTFGPIHLVEEKTAHASQIRQQSKAGSGRRCVGRPRRPVELRPALGLRPDPALTLRIHGPVQERR